MTDDKTKQKAIEAAADIYGVYLIHTYICFVQIIKKIRFLCKAMRLIIKKNISDFTCWRKKY
jgi:hypothetical protein